MTPFCISFPDKKEEPASPVAAQAEESRTKTSTPSSVISFTQSTALTASPRRAGAGPEGSRGIRQLAGAASKEETGLSSFEEEEEGDDLDDEETKALTRSGH